MENRIILITNVYFGVLTMIKEPFSPPAIFAVIMLHMKLVLMELYNALLNVQSGYVELLFFKLNSNFVFKPLKIDKVIFL